MCGGMSEATTILPCPRCGAAMHLHRTLPASFGYPELRTFTCMQCREVITVEAGPLSQAAGRARAT
jgi:hypothetical protein